ncbi:hypothetical protein LOAG_13124, partial [Loa loa]
DFVGALKKRTYKWLRRRFKKVCVGDRIGVAKDCVGGRVNVKKRMCRCLHRNRK